jgi:hypothetical protein
MTLTAAPSSVFPTIDGRGIGLSPAVSECTVAQAAEFLDMSERRLNALLDDERIAFRLENGERLVQWSGILDYEQMRKRREAWLDEMAQWDQEMGLYDD